jgi:pantothenate kinase type III
MADTKLTDQTSNKVDAIRYDPFGDGTDRIVAAIAAEVEYRESHGLPVVLDRGNGVELLSPATHVQ